MAMTNRSLPLFVVAAAAAVLGSLAASAAPPAAAPPAATGAPPAANTAAVTWDLTDLYPTLDAWTAAYARNKAATEHLTTYRGTLGGSAEAMLKALDAISGVRRELMRVYSYADLIADEDLRVAANQERRQQVQALQTLLDEQTAWLSPEILAVGAERTRAFIAANRELARRFGFFLDNILRAAPHTLGNEAEDVLAAAGNVLQQPAVLHRQLDNAELPFPTVTLADGTQARLDTASYEKHRQSPNRADRKLVFDAFWGAWKNFEATAGSMLATQAMGDEFTAKTRKYGGALEAALFGDNMPIGVYRTLVAETHAALPTLHRYLRLRQRLLGVSGPLEYYDNYAPLFESRAEPRFGIEESKRITLEALRPLGEDYLGLLRGGFAARWMDAYPHQGKASGAYMNGSVYDVHPYLLLNHNDDYYSLSTVAHEWGHAVHTLLANRAQPFENAGYSTFIAESASIGNEMLLNDYMVAHARNRDEKLYYLGRGLESIRTSFFRQVQFAEFELAIHEELEQGRPLSGARMTELYCGLMRQYYGEAEGVMKIDPAYCIEWAYVPHFYRDFYVYQYATSTAGAALLTEAVVKEGGKARERFLTLLSAGSSDYPYDLYKRAGIDMATPAPYRALAARMNRIMDEIEAELKRKH
jgi:oligoendopeptidase F